MNEQSVFDVLTRIGAFQTGHFELPNRRHSDTFIDDGLLLSDACLFDTLAAKLAEPFCADTITLVFGSQHGGAMLSSAVARHLSGDDKRVLSAFATRTVMGDIVLDRSRFVELLQGANVLVVEAIMTTGENVRALVELAQGFGARSVASVATIVNRGTVSAPRLGDQVVKLHCLCEIHTNVWASVDCPLCHRGSVARTNQIPQDSGSRFRKIQKKETF